MKIIVHAKVCSKCGKEKLIEQFHKDPSRRDGHAGHCKECRSEYNQSRKRPPRPVVEPPTTRVCGTCKKELPISQFRLRDKNGLHRHYTCKKCSSRFDREYHRKRRYAMSPEQYQALFDLQGGRCAICSRRRNLVIDHCHQTGNVRGLLCSACNTGIGNLGDTSAALMRAVCYLENSKNESAHHE